MKKIVLLIVTVLFAMSVTQAQQTDTRTAAKSSSENARTRVPLRKLEGTVVSPVAKANFASDFPGVTDVDWARVDTFDEATFNYNGQDMIAYYDFNGSLVGTTQTKEFEDIPAAGQKEIKEKYSDYTIGPVIYFNDNAANDTDMILWTTQFNGDNLYFAELTKGPKTIVVSIDENGKVSLFKELS